MSSARWTEIGGKRIYFRSLWEANFAFYLEWKKKQGFLKEWAHEPQTFWFDKIRRGCVSYLPDFRIDYFDGTHSWVEVKGFMDSRSRTKLKRFKKYYPQEEMKVVDGSWFRKTGAKLALLVPGWVKGTNSNIAPRRRRKASISSSFNNKIPFGLYLKPCRRKRKTLSCS